MHRQRYGPGAEWSCSRPTFNRAACSKPISASSAPDRRACDGRADGFIKVIVTRRGEVLGATIVGQQAGELAMPRVLAMARRLRIGAIANLIAPYPTHSEISRRVAGFERDAFNDLLFLRLVPLFPFWVANLAPALLDVRLRPFATATVIGIIPGALAYASVGDSFGRYFAAGTTVPFGKVFAPEMIAIRVGLALMALLPVAIRWLRRRSQR